jgi:hypothetical protein
MDEIFFSDDRNVTVYFFNNALTCRRTVDLETLWTQPIEAGLRAFPLGISARGDYVAASIARGGPAGEFERYDPLYVAVYEGKAGAEVARLDVNGGEGIALSQDGKLIAVVTRERGKDGEVLPTVHLREVSSGRELASVVHDRIKSSRRQFLEAGCTVAFTSDGRYMVTSGMLTKVWRLGE